MGFSPPFFPKSLLSAGSLPNTLPFSAHVHRTDRSTILCSDADFLGCFA